MWKRWNPFAELDALRREIDRVFEGYKPQGKGRLYSAFLPGAGARTYPLINMTEKTEEYVIEALAPGLDPEKLDVSVTGKHVTIGGEKTQLDGVEQSQFHRSERAAGRFSRTFTLDNEIDESKVSAHYTNGLLMVVLPKAESAKPKRIAVDVK